MRKTRGKTYIFFMSTMAFLACFKTCAAAASSSSSKMFKAEFVLLLLASSTYRTQSGVSESAVITSNTLDIHSSCEGTEKAR